MFKPLPTLVIVTISGIVGGWFIFAGLARLVNASVPWFPRAGSIPSSELFDVVRSAATVAALFGGLFAIVYAYRKQRVEEAAGHRQDAESLSTRYLNAAAQLGHENAAVRLAGAYAMGRLADDWPEQRQTCVDVLCAYVRMTAVPAHEMEDLSWRGEQQVRASIIRLVEAHLFPQEDSNWCNVKLDFSGATIERVDFSHAVFLSRPNFTNVQFVWYANFDCAIFECGADFVGARFAEGLTLREVSVAMGSIDLTGATFGGRAKTSISTRHLRENASLVLNDAICEGWVSLRLHQNERETNVYVDGLEVMKNGSFSVELSGRAKGLEASSSSWPLPIDPTGKVTVWAGGYVALPSQFKRIVSTKTRKGSEELELWTGDTGRVDIDGVDD